MSDQADALRQKIRARPEGGATRPRAPRSHAHSLLFTSGKGGVGTSNLTLNLAIALGARGQRVVVIDADLGLANLDLLCGLAPRHDLGSVLRGERSLADVMTSGPRGIRLVAGAHGRRSTCAELDEAPQRLQEELSELEPESDFLLIDAGSGLGRSIALLGAFVDEVVVVTTPEPTSLADAHAAIGRFRPGLGPEGPTLLRVLLNAVGSQAEAIETLDQLCADSRGFGGVPVRPLGYVRHDPRVPRSVRRRRPFLLDAPRGPAARCVRRIGRTLLDERGSNQNSGLLAGMISRWNRLDC